MLEKLLIVLKVIIKMGLQFIGCLLVIMSIMVIIRIISRDKSINRKIWNKFMGLSGGIGLHK